jgi:hypothetical protein
MDNNMPRGCLHTIRNGMIIMLLVLACGGSSILGIDVMCYNSLSKRLPIYPDSERTFAKHSFLRAFGMGETLIILETDDPIDVVRQWYGTTVGKVSRANRDNPVFFGVSSAAWSVAKSEDGTGTQIVLSGVCAS